MSTAHSTLDDAAAYARSSEDRQEASCPQQLEWAARKAADLSLNLAATFQDVGIPGDRLDRPGLESLFAFLGQRQKARRPVTTLLLFDQDRLSRGTSWAAGALMERLAKLGVERVVTATRELDLYDDAGRAIFGLEQDLAKRGYVKTMSRNVCRAVAGFAAKGCWNGGSPPYGYRIAGERHNRRLVPGPAEEVEAVRELFREAAKGVLTTSGLARLANSRRWPIPAASVLRQHLANEKRKARGKPEHAVQWTAGTVGGMLRQVVYIGTIRYGRRRKGKYHQAAAAGPVERRGPSQQAEPAQDREGCHEPLIDRATFDTVQAVVAARRIERHVGRLHPDDFAFSGRLTCACCGGGMQGRHKDAFHGYVCGTWRNGRGCSRNSLSEPVLLEQVAGLLEQELSTPATIARLRKRLEARRSACGDVLRQSLAKGRQHVAGLEQKLDEGGRRLLEVSKQHVARVERELDRLSAELETARSDVADLERQVAAQPPEEDIDLVLSRLSQLPKLLRNAEPAQRVRLVQLAVETVTLRFDVHASPTGRLMSRWAGATVELRGGGQSYEITVPAGPACRTGCPPRRRRRRRSAGCRSG
jgi:site-specific DNA recombinase